MTKKIRNYRDGYHLNSKHWQNYKSQIKPLPENHFNILIGMLLGDATMYYVSREAYIKFEQGWKQKNFLDHQFDLFSGYSFMIEPRPGYKRDGTTLKSYWFKTFSFHEFTRLYSLFYQKIDGKVKRKKMIEKGFLTKYLTEIGFAYWVMCDGSLDSKTKKTLTLHTQCFDENQNLILSSELNEKFGLQSHVIPHKKKYFVIEIPGRDSKLVHNLIEPYLISSMRYKLPRIN